MNKATSEPSPKKGNGSADASAEPRGPAITKVDRPINLYDEEWQLVRNRVKASYAVPPAQRSIWHNAMVTVWEWLERLALVARDPGTGEPHKLCDPRHGADPGCGREQAAERGSATGPGSDGKTA